MWVKRLIIVLTLLITTGSTTMVPGQTPEYKAGTSIGDEESEFNRKKGGLGLHYQVGASSCIGNNIDGGDEIDYVLTADLALLNRRSSGPAFGGGIHFALEQEDMRIGFKGLCRIQLDSGGPWYFQLAPGVFTEINEDNTFFRKSKTPGFFCEAEFGIGEWFALTSAVEFLPYEYRVVGYETVRTNELSSSTNPVYDRDGTVTSWYLGAKIGRWPALVATMAALIGRGVHSAGY